MKVCTRFNLIVWSLNSSLLFPMLLLLQNSIPFIFVEVFTFAIKIVPIISPKSIDVITILILQINGWWIGFCC